LVGATDNLHIAVADAILGVALAKSVAVPGPIKVRASESLYPLSRGRVVTHGQMMGAYLSFPLLCLQSLCAALWAGRGCGVRGVLVNGDDTLISTDTDLGQYPDGFELNSSKTIKSETVVELNSTVFLKKTCGDWKEVKNLRRGASCTDMEGLLHLSGACAKAGAKWQEAFVRSGVGRQWKLTPSQLGLSLRVHACWSRQSRMRVPCPPPLPLRASLPDDRFLTVFSKPRPDEQWAFQNALFNSGRRCGADEPVVFKGKKELWRVLYPLRGVPTVASRVQRGSRPFGYFLRYRPDWKPEPSRHRDRWFVDAAYAERCEELEVEERSRLLGSWLSNPEDKIRWR
jgi:hypothetical protein